MLRKYGTFVFGFDAAYGLALLVATGCVRDYPVDLSESARRARPAREGRATGTSFERRPHPSYSASQLTAQANLQRMRGPRGEGEFVPYIRQYHQRRTPRLV